MEGKTLKDDLHVHLSRRERQIMDIIYQRGSATAAEVLGALLDPPTYSAVRAMLRVLEQKGHLEHSRDGRRYVFTPTVPREKATRSVLKNLLDVFFAGSVEKAVAALIDVDAANLSEGDYDRLARMIDKARKEGR